jgi:hypothetical protein
MKNVATLLALVMGGMAAVALPGCVVTGTVSEHRDHPRPVIVEQPAPVYVTPAPPPPTIVVQQPAPVYVAPPPAEVIVVRQPLPPRVVEVVPAPQPGMIWISGYYAPRGGRWEWVRGHYERPPRQGAVWVPPHHNERGSDRVEFSMGFWR